MLGKGFRVEFFFYSVVLRGNTLHAMPPAGVVLRDDGVARARGSGGGRCDCAFPAEEKSPSRPSRVRRIAVGGRGCGRALFGGLSRTPSCSLGCQELVGDTPSLCWGIFLCLFAPAEELPVIQSTESCSSASRGGACYLALGRVGILWARVSLFLLALRRTNVPQSPFGVP
ncbi:hypothetical protein AGIG_G24404 [Arapaima gigas]